ncbi:MAG: 30S ribosome-binding factor RbfA [Bryobacterales bacterium]|nr:30S ribosome-binding factor RbfA [Bryobacterales bacterium]
MDPRRQQRVADAIRDELAELIVYELEDPRIRIAGITDVHLSPDGKHADVLVRTEGGLEQREATFNALRHASGFLRHQLMNRLALRYAPGLTFVSDTGAAPDQRMEALLKEARRWRRKLDAASASTAASSPRPSAVKTEEP